MNTTSAKSEIEITARAKAFTGAGLNEDEMRGVAVVEALKLKPGFSIDEVLVTIVSLPNDQGQTRSSHENKSS